jgi:UDP-glucose 4-epimerase
MSKCLVLGANGFIGGHLVDKLSQQGYEIRAFDRFGSNHINFRQTGNIEIVAGNFLNKSDLSEALKDIDYVFHLVSTTTPATAENDPLIDVDTNIRMSVELLQECVDHKIKKFIFASTGGAIYGNVKANDPIDESTAPQPVSPYAIGKLTIEHYLRYFKQKFELDTLVYRISNPYGERHSPVNRQGVIPIFLQHVANNEPITVLGDGSMVRDYIYVGDVADLVSKSFKKAQHDLYNLGSGQGVSVNELIDVVKKITGSEVKIEHQPKPATFLDYVVLDTNRFKSEFNLSPTISLEDGVARTWEYVKQHKAPVG